MKIRAIAIGVTLLTSTVVFAAVSGNPYGLSDEEITALDEMVSVFKKENWDKQLKKAIPVLIKHTQNCEEQCTGLSGPMSTMFVPLQIMNNAMGEMTMIIGNQKIAGELGKYVSNVCVAYSQDPEKGKKAEKMLITKMKYIEESL